MLTNYWLDLMRRDLEIRKDERKHDREALEALFTGAYKRLEQKLVDFNNAYCMQFTIAYMFGHART